MAKSPRKNEPDEQPDNERVDETQTAAPVVVKRKGKVPAVAWIAAMVVLGGAAAAVVMVVMKPGGEGEAPAPTTVAATTAVSTAAADAGVADAAADVAGEVADGAADGGDGAEVAEAVDEVADGADGAEVDADEVAVDADEVADGAGEVEVVDDAAGEVAAEVAAEVADDVGADGAVVGDADAAPADALAAADAADAAPAIVLDPKESTHLNELGLAARKAGDHNAARELYEKAVATNPDNVWARYNYACELAIAGKKKEALAELTTLYKMGTADARRALGAARKDSDFSSIRDTGQFFRLTNF